LALASMNFAQLFAHAREEFARTAQDAAQVTFALGVLRASYALAWMVGPNLGAAIKVHHGYPGLFVAAAAFFVLLSICVYAWVAYRERERVPAEPSASLETRSLPPIALAYCAGFGLMFGASTLNNLNLPLFLTEQLGGTERSVGAAFSISPLFELAFMVGFGHLAARGHARSVMLVGSGAAVVYFLALRFVTAPWQVYPLQMLNAAGVAVTVSVAIPFIQDLLPGRAGVATNLYANALKLGSLVGFSSFGLLARHVGHGGLFLVCAGLGSLTFMIVALVRPRPLAGE
jgi:SET family sugar efflux transporter-like MFS transporter